MSAVAFDTLKLARKLEESGFSPQQAAGASAALAEAVTADLATKADITQLENRIARLDDRMDSRFAHVDARFAELEQRMTIKLGTMILVGVGVLAALHYLPVPHP